MEKGKEAEEKGISAVFSLNYPATMPAIATPPAATANSLSHLNFTMFVRVSSKAVGTKI